MGGHGGSKHDSASGYYKSANEQERLAIDISRQIAKEIGVKLEGIRVVTYKGKSFGINVGETRIENKGGSVTYKESPTTIRITSHGPFGKEVKEFEMAHPQVFDQIKRHIKSR